MHFILDWRIDSGFNTLNYDVFQERCHIKTVFCFAFMAYKTQIKRYVIDI